MASLQNFSTMVGNMAAGVQGACATLLDLTVGSVLRAILEGSASVGLWIQYLILQVVALTRFATSFGADADSWGAQFGFTRLGGVASSVPVQFISLNPGATSATVPVGAIVKTTDTTLVFAVVQDATNPNWSASAGGYIRQAGITSITLPTECQVVGSIGNVAAGAVNLLGAQIPGIDTVTNLAAASGGSDQEADAAVKSRFVTWIASLASATATAIKNAVLSVQTGITLLISDGQDAYGTPIAGTFAIVFDDGSGDPPDSLVASVRAQVEATRACGITAQVGRAPITQAVVVVPVKLAAGATAATVQAEISTAITADINATAVGSGYSYARLSYLAYMTGGSLIVSVGVPTLNGAAADIPAGQTVRASSVAVQAN